MWVGAGTDSEVIVIGMGRRVWEVANLRLRFFSLERCHSGFASLMLSVWVLGAVRCNDERRSTPPLNKFQPCGHFGFVWFLLFIHLHSSVATKPPLPPKTFPHQKTPASSRWLNPQIDQHTARERPCILLSKSPLLAPFYSVSRKVRSYGQSLNSSRCGSHSTSGTQGRFRVSIR